jgi:hypothetical protein
VTTNEVAQRLSILLGEPTVSPGGKRIPPTEGEQEIQDWIPLKDLEVGSMGQIAQVQSHPPVQTFLSEQGLRPGATVIVKGIGKNGSRLIGIEEGFVQLSEGLAGEILILMSTPNQTSSPENSP